MPSALSNLCRTAMSPGGSSGAVLAPRRSRPGAVTDLSSEESHGNLPSANSVATEKQAANASRSRASARRRETILDYDFVAAAGGYEAVQMRTVAERVGIAVGTLYRYFPAKPTLLV